MITTTTSRWYIVFKLCCCCLLFMGVVIGQSPLQCPESGDVSYKNKPILDIQNDVACGLAGTATSTDAFTAYVNDETVTPNCVTYCGACEAEVCTYDGGVDNIPLAIKCSDTTKCSICDDPPGCSTLSVDPPVDISDEGPKEIRIEWTVQEYADITANVGDTITFAWINEHNVYINPAMDCGERSNAILLGAGDTTEVSYTFTEFDVGRDIYFACFVRSHCFSGQHITVSVTATTSEPGDIDPPDPPTGGGGGTVGGTDCSIAGATLTCPISSTITFNGADVAINSPISCPLDSVSQSDFQQLASEPGICSCEVSISLGNGQPQPRDDCDCFGCPIGSRTGAAYLCRDSPIVGPCFNFTCAGECNGDMSPYVGGDDPGIADCPGAQSIVVNEIVDGTFDLSASTIGIPGGDNIFNDGTSKQSQTQIPSCGMATQSFQNISDTLGFDDIPGAGDILDGFNDIFEEFVNDPVGHWYTVKGTGQPLRATTCHDNTNIPTSLVIMTGTCDFLSCVASDIGTVSCVKGQGSSFASTASTVTWISELDMTYYIWVSPHENFSLVTDVGTPLAYQLSVLEFVSIVNDDCDNAIQIALPEMPTTSINANETTGNMTSETSMLPMAVATGSTLDATRNFDYDEYCGVPLEFSGAWYKVVGRGSALTLSACTESTDYHAALSVFQMVAGGTGDFGARSTCGVDLKCIAGLDYSISTPCPFGVAGTVTWMAELDTTYYVYVHGGSSFQSSSGSYELILVDEFEVTEPNDFCNQAILLSLDMEVKNTTANVEGENVTVVSTSPSGESKAVSGSTNSATPDVTSLGSLENEWWSDCDAMLLTKSPGLFYKIEGYGGPLQVSTCSAGTDYNAAISVLQGSCDRLECETQQVFNSSTCNLGSSDASASRRRDRRKLRKFQDVVKVDNDLVSTQGSNRRRLRKLEEVFKTNHGADSLSWLSFPDETYYVLVHGEVDEDTADTGSFELTVQPITMPSFFCQEFLTGIQQSEPLVSCECAEATEAQVGDKGGGGLLDGLEDIFGIGGGEFGLGLNGISVSCSSPCQYCNPNESLCVENLEYSAVFDATFEPIMENQKFQYVLGRNESVEVTTDSDGSCKITVDSSATCSNCQVIYCPDGYEGYNLDCPELFDGMTNFTTCGAVAFDANMTNPFFEEMAQMTSPLVNGTILEALVGVGFEECLNYVPPTEAPTPEPQVDTPAPSMEPTKEPTKPSAGATISAMFAFFGILLTLCAV